MGVTDSNCLPGRTRAETAQIIQGEQVRLLVEWAGMQAAAA